MNRFYKISLPILLSLATTACFQTGQSVLPNYYPVATQQPYYPVQQQPQPYQQPYYPVQQQPYPAQGYNYNIPPGHMPPPGECRIWYPNRPAGQQPPPGKCKKLQKNVPYGAVLIHG